MESNTFATTIYAQTPAARAFDYLRRLENLDEWTLGSRMVERIDDDTFMGTASGYQSMLCYHVRTLPHPTIGAIEWQCGYRYREYFKQYPVFVFPSRWIDPRTDEHGSYIHWVSVVDPARRTPMIMEGIAAVHHYEGRGLKAALERREGLARPGRGRFAVLTDTMWVDAPIALARDELVDRAALPSWAPLLRSDGDRFRDEYDRRVEVTLVAHALDDYVLVEQDYAYPDLGALQRCPIVLIPCARAFGPGTPGLLLHRLAFVDATAGADHGRTRVEELVAESMAIKRRLEQRAGNLASFAKGMSWAPEGVRSGVHAGGGGSAAPPELFAPDFIADPYPAYARMRDEYPLYFYAPTRAWIVSRYDDVLRVLTDPSFTTAPYAVQTEPLLGKTLIQLDGREHSIQRSLLAPSFRQGGIRARFVALIERTVDALIDGFVARGRADLMVDLIAQFPVRIMAGILGLPADDHERFRGWYTALIRGALNLARDPEIAAAGERARDQLDAYLRPLIAERRTHGGDDLITQLSTAEVDGAELSDDEIVRFGMLMVFAAGETTEKGLATTVRNLLAHPDAWAAVCADRSLVPRAIAESFRFTAPTHMLPRKAIGEVALSGGTIPAGAEVMCFIGAANRDERRFADPDRFDLQRPEADPDRAFTGQAQHLAFGAGRHFCLGAMLSRYEIELSLGRLIDRLPGLALDCEVPPPDVGLFLRGPTTLPVRFDVP